MACIFKSLFTKVKPTKLMIMLTLVENDINVIPLDYLHNIFNKSEIFPFN